MREGFVLENAEERQDEAHHDDDPDDVEDVVHGALLPFLMLRQATRDGCLCSLRSTATGPVHAARWAVGNCFTATPTH